MKSFLILAFLAVVFAEELYTTENDNIDIEGIVKDSAQLKAFVDCFNDKGDCNEVSGDFKKDMAEVFQLACAKCTPEQKHILKRFLEGLKEKLPADLETFKAKYDPDNKKFTALEAAISKS